ncbi:MAG: L7Ae/L30e/S12e/Gadd45 family ribosomal protein, partial [Fervidobacterium pennivorans]
DQRLKTKVILIATDVGPRVKKDIQIRCKINNIPIVQIFSKYQLSKAVGLREVSVIGIADENLAKSIIDVLNLVGN